MFNKSKRDLKKENKQLRKILNEFVSELDYGLDGRICGWGPDQLEELSRKYKDYLNLPSYVRKAYERGVQ